MSKIWVTKIIARVSLSGVDGSMVSCWLRPEYEILRSRCRKRRTLCKYGGGLIKPERHGKKDAQQQGTLSRIVFHAAKIATLNQD